MSLYAMASAQADRLAEELRQNLPHKIPSLAAAHEVVHHWAGRWDPAELTYLLIALKQALAPDPTEPPAPFPRATDDECPMNCTRGCEWCK